MEICESFYYIVYIKMCGCIIKRFFVEIKDLSLVKLVSYRNVIFLILNGLIEKDLGIKEF